MVKMGKYVRVSVKVPVELKEKMEKYGIKPSHVLRKAIEDCIKREEIKRLKEKIEEVKLILEKIPEEDIVKSIREDRNSR
ncbi:MAG: CopG family transcriptional regulator [Nitrososphaeria archaeon]